MNFKTPMFQMVELIIGPNGTPPGPNSSTYFQQQPQLQSYLPGKAVYVKAITTFSNQAISTSPQTSGSPVATPADILNGVLTLVVKGTESIKQVPLALLNTIWADPANFVPYTWAPFRLQSVFEIDWGKSYVTTLAQPAAAPFSYLFGVHYSYLPDPDDAPYLQAYIKAGGLL